MKIKSSLQNFSILLNFDKFKEKGFCWNFFDKLCLHMADSASIFPELLILAYGPKTPCVSLPAPP